VDRKNWRVLLSWHIAETREKARAEARDGLLRTITNIFTATLQRPGARRSGRPMSAWTRPRFRGAPAATTYTGTI